MQKAKEGGIIRSELTTTVGSVEVPRFFYGTAWKEDHTQRLAEVAIQQGFRAIDTANQRRHYHEAAVGQAVSSSVANGRVAREDLFLQSKFTFRRGQDHRLPYDPAVPVADQVEQSFDSTLEHLGVDRIDSYLLHGPTNRVGLAADDWAAWNAMEAIHDSGRTKLIGVSNVSLEQLQSLFGAARVKPSFVQNRCYAATGWDFHVREFCASHGVLYQGFSLLTANQRELSSQVVRQIAVRHQRTIPQIVFRFSLEVGMIPLTGTSSADHMREDLDVFAFGLAPEEVQRMETLAVG